MEDGFFVGYRSAENLLVDARRALVARDDERAGRYIETAVVIPWDERKEHIPAIAAAEFARYTSLGGRAGRVQAHERQREPAPQLLLPLSST